VLELAVQQRMPRLHGDLFSGDIDALHVRAQLQRVAIGDDQAGAFAGLEGAEAVGDSQIRAGEIVTAFSASSFGN
jgi:hypothetical protein